MKKVVRLSENDFKNKIKSLIQEQDEEKSNDFPTLVSHLLFSQENSEL